MPVFTKIKFGEGITQVDYRYFAMEGIKQISLPKSFKKIKYASPVRVNGAYEGWSTTLKKISVNKKNRNFSSSKGVLYSKDKKTIYIYPSGKSVTNYKLSDKVTTIAPYAFYACGYEINSAFFKANNYWRVRISVFNSQDSYRRPKNFE